MIPGLHMYYTGTWTVCVSGLGASPAYVVTGPMRRMPVFLSGMRSFELIGTFQPIPGAKRCPRIVAGGRNLPVLNPALFDRDLRLMGLCGCGWQDVR